MYPNNNQSQPGQVFQPQAPQQQPQQAQNLDFTQQGVQQPTPQPNQQPQAPAFDPNAFKQEVIDGVKQALQPQQPQQAPAPAPQNQNQPQYFNKNYDDWGVLEQDTKALVQDVVKEQIDQLTQQNTEAQRLAAEREKQTEEAVDKTFNDLRGAGYLPPVVNKFDINDPGKQAEHELLGYAVYLGTSDLVKAAQELKFKHDTGLRYDYQSKQFVSTGQQQDSGPSIFGNNLPVTPDGQPPVQQYPQQMLPQPIYPQPYGPQNPYMPRPQYPAGFNAPVASGGGYMGVGMQGQIPQTGTLRHNSYDQLVDMFNRTQ